MEMDLQPLLEGSHRKFKNVYSIRPLASGNLFHNSDWNIDTLIKFSYNHPGVNGIVISISEKKHLLEILNCLWFLKIVTYTSSFLKFLKVRLELTSKAL